MDAELSSIMRRIAQKHGPEVFGDSKLFAALLADYSAGQFHGERRNLVVACEEGLFEKIRKAQGPAHETINSLAAHFSQTYGWTGERAELIVRICYEALTGESVQPPSKVAAEGGKPETDKRNRYRLAAERGEAEAQYKLGFAYYYGFEVEADCDEAVKWYRLAAGQGHAKAQYELGHVYLNGEGAAKGVAADMAEAFKWFRVSAEQGYPPALLGLTCVYIQDKKTKTLPHDDESKWRSKLDPMYWHIYMRCCAEKNHRGVQYKLGKVYWNGEVATEDKAEAVKWYRLAAEPGPLGTGAGALYELWRAYYCGEGAAKDIAEAFMGFRLMAKQINYNGAEEWSSGHAGAQYELGKAYYYGEGVAKDKVEAVKWYRLASEQRDEFEFCDYEYGHAGAQYELGKAYYYGEGVAKNKAKALKCYRLAATNQRSKYEHGHAGAQYELGKAYYYGEGVAKDHAEAVKWYRLASEQRDEFDADDYKHGHAVAQHELGKAYYYGEGVAKDQAEALKWFRLAAEQGHEEARAMLGKIKK